MSAVGKRFLERKDGSRDQCLCGRDARYALRVFGQI